MTVSVSLRVGLLALLGMMALPMMASANNDCGFTRTLDSGVEGEDVRCLQQYLNDRGYTIATQGGGAPGNETTRFGSLTEAAVIRWQEAKGIFPASGVFGPQSQSTYLLDLAAELEALLGGGVMTAPGSQPLATTNVVPQVAGAADSAISAVFVEALELIEEADDEVEHLVITDQSFKDELRHLNKAKREFMAAAMSYFTGNEADARVSLEEVIEYAEAAIDGSAPKVTVRNTDNEEDEDEDEKEDKRDIDKDEKTDAWDAIDEEWDDYNDVKETLNEEDEDDDNVIEAAAELKAAGKVLSEAEDAADDGDFDEAQDLVEEADSLIDTARNLL